MIEPIGCCIERVTTDAAIKDLVHFDGCWVQSMSPGTIGSTTLHNLWSVGNSGRVFSFQSSSNGFIVGRIHSTHGKA